MIIGQLDRLQKGEKILMIASVAVALSALLHCVIAGSAANQFGMQMRQALETPRSLDRG
jgi:hypothetical protein